MQPLVSVRCISKVLSICIELSYYMRGWDSKKALHSRLNIYSKKYDIFGGGAVVKSSFWFIR